MNWIERLRTAIADRGRELLKLNRFDDVPALCRQLLAGGHGEASGVALAREILRAWSALPPEGRRDFFRTLEMDFGPDPAAVRDASVRYLETGSAQDLDRLVRAVEPRRQELFRRLNMAPQGTTALVRMREELLPLLQEDPALKSVDRDFRHLLGSWFNRGFLQLRAITWRSPAHILEKLIDYESVHAIRGWEDLRRRLSDDRRCFAFFHPAMPDEPLIFVEVALQKGMASVVQPLLDPSSPVGDPAAADTAIFYSINNTQVGLRGISFGNFLIKQVVEELRTELPRLRRFATLSPMPRFAAWLRSAPLEAVLGGNGRAVEAEGFLARLDDPLAHRSALEHPLRELGLYYLLQKGPKGPLDPVAAFHLANGARLEAVNAFADTSEQGLANSYGLMVNYLYLPDEVEANHERFVATGEVALSRSLARLRRKLPG